MQSFSLMTHVNTKKCGKIHLAQYSGFYGDIFGDIHVFSLGNPLKCVS